MLRNPVNKLGTVEVCASRLEHAELRSCTEPQDGLDQLQTDKSNIQKVPEILDMLGMYDLFISPRLSTTNRAPLPGVIPTSPRCLRR